MEIVFERTLCGRRAQGIDSSIRGKSWGGIGHLEPIASLTKDPGGKGICDH